MCHKKLSVANSIKTSQMTKTHIFQGVTLKKLPEKGYFERRILIFILWFKGISEEKVWSTRRKKIESKLG